MANKRKPEAEKNNATMQISLTREEKRQLNIAAATLEKSASSLIREALRKEGHIS